MLDNWQRIESVVKWTGMSVNSFARTIGLNRAENLYQIKRGNNGISRDLANLIATKYPQISKAWLLTGEGEMFRKESPAASDIPFFKIDAEHYKDVSENYKPQCSLNLPMFEGCDFATLTFSRAMMPNIPVGAIVLFKTIDKHSIIPGNDYLVISERITALRCLRTAGDPETYRFVPYNTEEYDEFQMHLSEMQRVYMVKGVIINKSI